VRYNFGQSRGGGAHIRRADDVLSGTVNVRRLAHNHRAHAFDIVLDESVGYPGGRRLFTYTME
jgi:hypothetical protein